MASIKSSGEFFNLEINCNNLALNGITIISYNNPPSGSAKMPKMLITTVANPYLEIALTVKAEPFTEGSIGIPTDA